jgi:hypothetical protein
MEFSLWEYHATIAGYNAAQNPEGEKDKPSAQELDLIETALDDFMIFGG